jgi:hypothetical protein
VTVREAIEAFQAGRLKAGEITRSTERTDWYRLKKLLPDYGGRQLTEITLAVLTEFFDRVKGNKPSLYASVNKLFEWSRKRGYVLENPAEGFDKKRDIGEYGVNNEYYPVPVFKRMLMIAAGLEPVKKGGEPTNALRDLLPLFVVSGFLGLRSCEARRETRAADSIRWSDLHWDAEVPCVEVRPIVAKGKGRVHKGRFIETSHYLEAAKVWLEFYGKPGTDCPIVPWTKRQIQELKRDFKKATGMKFTENGFRNSFATYALTFNGVQGVGKLALEMGDSERICMRHYVRTIAPGSGKAWFELRPFEVVPIAPIILSQSASK